MIFIFIDLGFRLHLPSERFSGIIRLVCEAWASGLWTGRGTRRTCRMRRD